MSSNMKKINLFITCILFSTILVASEKYPKIYKTRLAGNKQKENKQCSDAKVGLLTGLTTGSFGFLASFAITITTTLEPKITMTIVGGTTLASTVVGYFVGSTLNPRCSKVILQHNSLKPIQ